MLESRACSVFFILQATFLMLNLKNNSADFKIEIKNKMIS